MMSGSAFSCLGSWIYRLARIAGVRNWSREKMRTDTPRATNGSSSSRRRMNPVTTRAGRPGAGRPAAHRLLLGERVVILPAVDRIPVPPAHPRAHHLEGRRLGRPDARDVVVRDLRELLVERLPLGRIRRRGGLLNEPVRLRVAVAVALRVIPLARQERL